MEKNGDKPNQKIHALNETQNCQQITDQQAGITIKFGNIDNYYIVERIGRGKYSTVFLGRTIKDQPCVLKVLKPVSITKINKEIKILEELKGGPNVCQLYDVVFDSESQSITLVMEYIESIDFRVLYEQLTLADVKFYTYNILKCLRYAHSKGVMHRDIKPQNIMIDHYRKKLAIIDWGLADHYNLNAQYHVRVATVHYKAPELLLSYPYYNFAVDIWGLGCTFASMLFKRFPFFRGRDNNEMLLRISSFIDGALIIQYAEKLSLQIPQNLQSKITDRRKKTWEDLKNEKNENMYDPLALDLLSKMLTIDHTDRITASDAINHPFFDDVRDL